MMKGGWMGGAHFIALAILVLLSTPLEAGEEGGKLTPQRVGSGDCFGAGQTTADILDCLGDANRSDDKELNATYQQIMRRLSPQRRAQLRARQRRWLEKRKSECNAEAYSTGSWWPVIYGQCIDSSTIVRTDWLKQNYRRDLRQIQG
jgi:uncharacterized protein YecT (DUF1311 family)